MLEINVNNQTLTRTDDFKVVAKSVDYLTATFTFSDDWTGTTKTALFESPNGTVVSMILTDEMCKVPPEFHSSAGTGSISVKGTDGTKLITTDSVKVEIDKTGYTTNVAESVTPTPDMMTQLSDKITQIGDNKVGYAEYTDSYLDLYTDSTKNKLIASLLIAGGSSSGGTTVAGISEAKCRQIITSYGYITDDSLSIYVKSDDLAQVATSGNYNDLLNKPNIPNAYDDTTVKDLINTKVGYLVYENSYLKAYNEQNGTLIASIYITSGAGGLSEEECRGIIESYGYITSSRLTSTLNDYAKVDKIPSRLSQLTNDSNYVIDANYMHTDVNFTSALKNKLDSLSNVVVSQTLTSGTEIATISNVKIYAPILSSSEKQSIANLYVETDPTVPSWAKESTKPTYTADEVGALPDTTIIPTVPTEEISANTAARHYHTNKEVLDGITSDKVSTWDGKQDALSESDKQAIADLHVDTFTETYKTEVETMWSDWQKMETNLTALEGVI